MNFDSYDIYFSGQIMRGQDPELVKQKIGAMFKLDSKGVERLFSGNPVRLKQGIDMEQAGKYRAAFREAGALIEIRMSEATPPLTQQNNQRNGKHENDALTVSNPQGYDLSDCAPKVVPRVIDDLDSDLAQPGAILDLSPPIEPLTIDTSDLDLDPPGVRLIEEPIINTPKIDTSSLTLKPAHEGTLEDCLKPVAPATIPNSLKLTLEDAQPENQSKGFDFD